MIAIALLDRIEMKWVEKAKLNEYFMLIFLEANKRNVESEREGERRKKGKTIEW